jgi:hypothetical protein
MDSDHDIGECTSDTDCEAQCAAHCAGMGYQVFNEACEGFCENSTNPGAPCTDDPHCPGGSCPGPTGGPHAGNPCNCDCNAVVGGASPAGTLQCNLGVNIDVETGSPCDGTDILIAVGTRCIPLTSNVAVSQLHNTNNTPAKDFPDPAWTATGAGVTCDSLTNSITSGLNLVGAVNFFDSTIGDLQSRNAPGQSLSS